MAKSINRLNRSVEINSGETPARIKARLALLKAAVEVFGEAGFESATTREIAKRSRQNSAAIAYYFGGKAGLYEAVISHIVDILNGRIGRLLQSAEDFLAGPHWPRDQTLHYLREILATSVANSKDSEIIALTQIIVREQTHPTAAFDILYGGFLGRLQKIGMRLMAAYVTGSPNSADFSLRFHALLGQALAFRNARETVLRTSGWKSIGSRQESAIRLVVFEQAEIVLESLRLRFEKGPAGK